jgi:hypothetical protein
MGMRATATLRAGPTRREVASFCDWPWPTLPNLRFTAIRDGISIKRCVPCHDVCHAVEALEDTSMYCTMTAEDDPDQRPHARPQLENSEHAVERSDMRNRIVLCAATVENTAMSGARLLIR